MIDLYVYMMIIKILVLLEYVNYCKKIIKQIDKK